MTVQQVSIPTTAASRPAARPPRRVLLVTGSMGEGHHAAARAVEEAARDAWPDAEVAWTDTLDGMGRGTGGAFRGIYAGCLRYLPWLYALYFWLLGHVGPFRAGTRAVIGAWSGRGLAPALARHDPDLVVATFPEGITGLGWLRRHGRLGPVAVALVADPAPHPLWADAALDLHLVSTPTAADLLRRAAPGASVQVAGLPVAGRFAPPAAPARRARPLVYVSCGSLAFGDVARACRAALDGGADVLVSCGRDAAVRRRLETLAGEHPRGAALRVEDWIDDPAAATRDCDAVVTNAGGATALEAVACGRRLLLFAPIPGHGRANAAVLEAEGLARVCPRPADLRAAVAELRDPADTALRPPVAFADAVADLAGLRPPPARGARVRAQDALFFYAATPTVPQQVGARIVVEDPGGRDDWPQVITALVRERLPSVPLLHRRLARPRPGRPLRWSADASPEGHVRPDVLDDGPDTVDAFFATPLDPATTGWELQVTRDRDAGEVAVLAKVHHALGDGLAVTEALTRLLTDACPSRVPAPAVAPTRVERIRRAATVVRGIVALALAGPAGPSPVTGRSGPGHRHAGVRFDGARVRAAARAHGVGTTVLMLAVVADAVGELLERHGRPATHLRAMVPMTTRTSADVASHAPGNRTAAVSVALPLGPMPGAERVARVARAVVRGTATGEPEGAAAVLGLLGLLPGRVQAVLVRQAYGRRFFHVLASVMPGVRRPTRIAGALVRAVYPVLPLADGVGLAVGVMHWGRDTTVGITADPALIRGIGGIPAALATSFDRIEGNRM